MRSSTLGREGVGQYVETALFKLSYVSHPSFSSGSKGIAVWGVGGKFYVEKFLLKLT